MSYERGQVVTAHAFSSGHDYAIRAEVRYKLLAAPTRTGRGRTVSLSSSLVVFEPEERLPAGQQIELRIAWPTNLNGSVGLRLCVTGTILENQASCATVKIQRHEFRTVYLARQGEATRG